LTTPGSPAPGVHARRVIFIDLARALAVVLMVSGHTSSALLASSYRQGDWIRIWEFQRGLTSALFLLLSGFAFSVATTRHWTSHIRPSLALVQRLRRFALFILLGYALHFPVRRFAQLATATDQQWRAFLSVDVLQLIGVTFIAVQLLVLITRSRRAFMVVAFALAAVLIGASPAMWRIDWTARLPLAVASYLSPGTGSQFPVLPWAGFVLIGAGVGQIYARWGAAHLSAFANGGMLLPGVVLTLVASNMNSTPVPPSGVDDWSWVPGQVLLRTGVCLVILGLVAHASRRISQLPHVFGAVAQESLLVYFVHLCIVYGSPWNSGLYQVYGEALGPGATVLAVIGVVLPMIALAWQWNGLKHHRPRLARVLSIAIGVAMAGWLI
jgi:uncharacterized membrane protein/type IV secretory pathway VirB2 component (pilin)